MSRGKSSTEVYSNFAAYLKAVATEARSPEKVAEAALWVVGEAHKKMLERARIGEDVPVVRVSWGIRYGGSVETLHEAVLDVLSDDLVCSPASDERGEGRFLEFGVWGDYFKGCDNLRGRVSSVRCG